MSAEPWRQALVPVGATLAQVIRNLNESTLQIVVVVSSDDRLIGTITDGDIRRGLLRGLTMDSSIEDVIFREPLVVPPLLARETVLDIMKANQIQQLPVVDDRRRVVGLHRLADILEPPARVNHLVIMAGGEGRRLRPETDDCPKPLLPVGGKPILEHIVERARAEGFHRLTMTLHYLGHMVENHFGDGGRWNVRIEYLKERSPLGTAGALGLLNPRPAAPIVVTNGDVLTDIRFSDLLDFHLRHDAVATMAVRQFEWQHPFGVVHTKGVDIIGIDEKPVMRSHVNAGVYALNPSALDFLKADEPCDMPALFLRLRESGARTIVYPMHEPWLDVGRAVDLERARHDHPQPSGSGRQPR